MRIPLFKMPLKIAQALLLIPHILVPPQWGLGSPIYFNGFDGEHLFKAVAYYLVEASEGSIQVFFFWGGGLNLVYVTSFNACQSAFLKLLNLLVPSQSLVLLMVRSVSMATWSERITSRVSVSHEATVLLRVADVMTRSITLDFALLVGCPSLWMIMLFFLLFTLYSEIHLYSICNMK